MKLSVIALLAAVAVFLGIANSPGVIKPKVPGAYNSLVTQANIATTICTKGWTATIRPPQNFTRVLKVQQIQLLHYEDTNPSSYEEDHLIPLELGGNPNNVNTLWPEPWNEAHRSDKVENFLNRQVCQDKTTLRNARIAIKRFKYDKG